MALEASLDVAVNSDVAFTFSVVNAGDSPVELTFRSSKAADVAVMDDGEEIWRWSDGQMFAQVINTVSLDPDEQVSETFTWEDPPSGEYRAIGTLEADSPVEAQAAFTV